MSRASDLDGRLQTVVVQYRQECLAAARAEATHKEHRAKRKLLAQAKGEAKSDAGAETIAEADDTVASLYMKRLTTAAEMESTKQYIYSLRESLANERTYIVNERIADQLHAQSRSVT